MTRPLVVYQQRFEEACIIALSAQYYAKGGEPSGEYFKGFVTWALRGRSAHSRNTHSHPHIPSIAKQMTEKPRSLSLPDYVFGMGARSTLRTEALACLESVMKEAEAEGSLEDEGACLFDLEVSTSCCLYRLKRKTFRVGHGQST